VVVLAVVVVQVKPIQPHQELQMKDLMVEVEALVEALVDK
jgi:hypothetical protein